LEVRLLDEIDAINERAASGIVAKAHEALGDLRGRRVTLLGLAFKPETDDVRMAPALRVAEALLDAGATVVGYDPRATAAAKQALPELMVDADPYRALEGADCAVVCTEWDQIRDLDLERVRAVMARPVIVDGRNVFEADRMAAAGFDYMATGRPSSPRPAERILTS
jgi:UDPglucose 6-dehydrogenase